MQYSNGLQFLGLCFVLVLAHVAKGQEKNARVNGLNKENATTIFGGNADRWLHELVDSRVELDTRISLDRLSFFNLSPTQIEKLTAAAKAESSDEKRVLLWHAMRQCRDVKTRDHLIQVLLGADVEMRIQFLDELENPTRFDVPILVSLYTNQHTPGTGATAAPKASKHSESKISDHEKAGNFGDLSDVRRRIVELATQTRWSCSWSRAGWPHPDDDAFRSMMFNEVEVNSLRDAEVQIAQEQIVYWLIKHGVEDAHRLMAFEMFVHSKSWRERRSYWGIGSDLLKGLDQPESRAKAVQLVMPWIDPHRFLLGQEPEIVRLRAVEAMHAQLAKEYADPNMELFDARLELQKPIVAQVQSSDPSPTVRDAAKRLLERMAYCEQNAPRLRHALAVGGR